MKKVLTKTKELFYYSDGKRVEGPNPNMSGDCTGLWGNCTGLWGDCTRLWGYCSGLSGCCGGLWGYCSGLEGNLDAAQLTEKERREGVKITELIAG